MAGYGNFSERLSEKVLDDLFLTCTAVSDGENTVLIFSSDTISLSDFIADHVAKIALEKHGIPVENVLINTTHTHAGPALYGESIVGMAKYIQTYYAAAEKIMGEALRDLAPAKIFTGRGQTVGLNYVRRYVTLDGKTYLGNWPKRMEPTEGRHETEADTEVQVILFQREGKKDVLLCNWQCHATTTGGKERTDVSADFVCSLRDQVEEEAGVLFSYHQGASGNLVPITAIAGEKNNRDHILHGQEIAQVALSILKDLTPVSGGKVMAKKIVLAAPYSKEYKEKHNITSRDTEKCPLFAFAIGDVAFGSFPGELCDSLGVELKEKSPYAMTFVCAYTSGSNGYLPAEYIWNLGGFEYQSCCFVKGTCEKMVEEILGALNKFHG